MNDEPSLTLMPLYRQVREHLTTRLIEGDWKAGEVIPSEIQLARELGVSQGTVRKALDEMVRDNILRRKQGRGTFVAKSDDADFVFQFFRIQPDAGEKVLPTSDVLSVRRRSAIVAIAAMLEQPTGAKVIEIKRTRSLAERPVIFEKVVIRQDLHPDFPARTEIPNNLYNLYAKRWGIRVGRTDERLKAIAADEERADALGCAAGTPLLRIERVARDLGGTPVELRISDCLTDGFHFAASAS